MDYEALRQLYERLIRQGSYGGDVCPAEPVLVAYDSGIAPAAQRKLVEQHLAECPPCRDDFVAIGQAGQWFRQNETRILGGLAAKAAAAGVLPWARCPSVGLLYRYVSKDIPDSRGGRILLAEVQQHLVQCPDCVRLANEFRSAMEGQSLSISDLGASIALTVLDRLRDFVDALVATAQAGGAPAFVRGAPGFRSAEVPGVTAPVIDDQGKLLVDAEGSARQCRFEIIQASIKEDGFLIVDLSAEDRQYHSREDCRHEALACILAGGVRLVLPRTVIDEQGRATFSGMLPEAKAVDPLPPSALDIIVRQKPDEESPAED